MRFRHRRTSTRRRFDELVLNVRTARWLGLLLWRPALSQLARRSVRRRRRRGVSAVMATMRPGR